MPASLSIYLDLVRFMAALAVFLTHLSSFPFTKDVLWWRLGQFGDQAVIIFFALSGYVISFVTSKRENHAQAYFASRASRMYSVILIALPLTLIFDNIGMLLNPAFYGIQKVLWKPESWAGYLSSLFFVNEYRIFGFNGISPGTNGPYWSLSFEATYYLLAGIVLFSRRSFWIPVSLIILGLAGRTIAALLPIWALGFVLYRMRMPNLRPTLSLQVAFWGSALLLVFSPVIEKYLPDSGRFIWLPWGRGPFNRDLVNDYYVASTFAVHLLSARVLLANGFKPFDHLKSIIRWLGSLTFPLYLFHYPALCLFSAISPWDDTSAKRIAFVSAMTALLVVALTPLCDKIKETIRIRMIFEDFVHRRILDWFNRYARRRLVGE